MQMRGFSARDAGPPEGLCARVPFVLRVVLEEREARRLVAAAGDGVGVLGAEAEGEGCYVVVVEGHGA